MRTIRLSVMVLIVVAVCSGCGGPQPPRNVKASSVRKMATIPGGDFVARGWVDSIEVSWDEVGGADSYTIYWAETPRVTVDSGEQVQNVTSPYNHIGTVDHTYYFIVTSTKKGKESEPSAEVSAKLKRGNALGGIYFSE